MKRVLIIPSCQEVHEGLTEFLEGAQPWHARLGYRLHLLLCTACRGLARAFRALPELVRRGSAPVQETPPEARAALDQALKALGGQGGRAPR
jgi:predicted anti-sigma-YlaC factor YlaD